jgi:GMP synthase (glutamine-hydrolysing)
MAIEAKAVRDSTEMLEDRSSRDTAVSTAETMNVIPPSGSHDRPSEKLPVLIILHQEHSNPGHVGQWFVRNGHALDIRRPRFDDPLPASLAHHCGAVIFGGPMSANDSDAYIKRETEFIGVALKEEKPFFGICLGAQMLARHLGARVYLDDRARVEIGYCAVTPTEPAQAIAPWPDRFYEWHKEGFDCPSGAKSLATGDGPFPVQAMSYGSCAIGVQFHPEITFAQVHRWTGHNPDRLRQDGAHPRHRQIEDHITHAPRVHRWLDRMLSRWVAANLPLR